MIVLPPAPKPDLDEPLVGIKVYVSPAERARLQRDARAAGTKLSPWCRTLLMMEDTDGAS